MTGFRFVGSPRLFDTINQCAVGVSLRQTYCTGVDVRCLSILDQFVLDLDKLDDFEVSSVHSGLKRTYLFRFGQLLVESLDSLLHRHTIFMDSQPSLFEVFWNILSGW